MRLRRLPQKSTRVPWSQATGTTSVPLTRKKSFRFYGYGDLCFYPHYILFYFMIPKERKRLAEVRGLKLKKVGSLFPMRLRAYDYENLINRDKASLDIFWLK